MNGFSATSDFLFMSRILYLLVWDGLIDMTGSRIQPGQFSEPTVWDPLQGSHLRILRIQRFLPRIAGSLLRIHSTSHLQESREMPLMKKLKFPIYYTGKKENQIFLIHVFLIRKFRMEQLQNHTWLTASSYMGKYLRISSYIRKPFLIYDFATAPLWISLYMRKLWFSFLSVYKWKAQWKSAKGDMSFLLFRESSVPVTRPSLLPPLVENRVASPGPSYRHPQTQQLPPVLRCIAFRGWFYFRG